MTTNWGGISKLATIGPGNEFSQGVIIGPNVTVGANNRFGPYACIEGDVDIGDDNYFAAHTTIGGASRQRLHLAAAKWPLSKLPRIRIGNGNLVFEHVVIHRPLRDLTAIGNRNSIGAHSHIGHDATLADNCVLAPGVLIGGFCSVGDCANLGMGAAIHNRVAIGAYAMIGMNSAVATHVRPGVTAAGVPARFLKTNSIGLQRGGIPFEVIAQLKRWIEDSTTPTDLGLTKALDSWERLVAESGRIRTSI